MLPAIVNPFQRKYNTWRLWECWKKAAVVVNTLWKGLKAQTSKMHLPWTLLDIYPRYLSKKKSVVPHNLNLVKALWKDVTVFDAFSPSLFSEYPRFNSSFVRGDVGGVGLHPDQPKSIDDGGNAIQRNQSVVACPPPTSVSSYPAMTETELLPESAYANRRCDHWPNFPFSLHILGLKRCTTIGSV